MTLDELATARPFALPREIPDWTVGCFRRRSITYATGVEDADTQVIWVQSHGLTGDIRIPKTRPALSGKHDLGDCTAGELATLAHGDGFAAQTSWRDGLMYWDAFAAFQPYDRWPEPGRLERVGTCMIEWAPSGAYVEDWYLQPGSSGLAAGLRLVEETGLDGKVHPREGALVIAGDHAILVLDRRAPFPSGRAQDLIAAAKDPNALARTMFDASVAYAIRQGEDYEIALAVDPFANGRSLFLADGFEAGAAEDELIQHPGPTETFSLRRWKIDTLLADQHPPRATLATETGMAWLKAETEG